MKKIRFCAAALALGIACSLAACGGTEGQEEPPKGEEEMKLDNLVENFWETDTMYDETVMLVAETDADGNIVSAPEGKLSNKRRTTLSGGAPLVPVRLYGRLRRLRAERCRFFPVLFYFTVPG